MINQFLAFVAHASGRLNFPRSVKFLIFLLVRGRNIEVNMKLKESGSIINLDIGNYVDYETYVSGLHEKGWIAKAKKYTKGKVFLDIGANIGTYSLSLAPSSKQIYAFEPEKNNYNRLLRNINLNNITNIIAEKKAVYLKNGRLKLYIDKQDSGRHSTVAASSHYQTITTISLDSYIKQKNIKNIGLIKIDVEGGEIDVLRGAEKTISKGKAPILIEVNVPMLSESGHMPEDIYKFLYKYRYKSFRLINGVLKKAGKKYINSVNSENFLFIPEQK